MDYDLGSNFTVVDGLPALSRTVATYYTAAIDHAGGIKGSYHLSCGTWDTSLVATLQHSSDDGDADAYTDEADTTYGNVVSVTLLAAGEGEINVPNPRERYTRVKLVLGGTCVAGITNIKGPLDVVETS